MGALQSGGVHPHLDLGKAIAASAFGREQQEQAEDRANRRLDAASIEDVIFDDDSAGRSETTCELPDERSISFVVLAMNDIRQKNCVVTSWDRIASVIAGDELYSALHAGSANVPLGDFESRR